jgi:hypothetical protein
MWMHPMKQTHFSGYEMKFKNVLSTKMFPSLFVAIAMAAFTGCLFGHDEHEHAHAYEHEHKHRLYVAHEGSLLAYNIATSAQEPGEITDIAGPTDMQALEDGTVLVNLSTRNEVLAFDGETMIEKIRIPSSTQGATKPTHSYITPYHEDKRFWVTLNDGAGTAATNSALFINVTPGSADFLKVAGEIGLGVGHHKAAFSKNKSRVVISNISDTNEVLAVFDYTNTSDIKKIAGLSLADLGIKDASPHGCGTAGLTGKVYCNLTTTGDIISVDIDAAAPTFKVLKTKGSGAGYTKGHGRYVYSLQSSPREGDTVKTGVSCQVGQLVVIDAQVDTVVNEIPLKYGGQNCSESILAQVYKTAGPGHIVINGTKMYVQLASGFTDPTGMVAKHLVLDLTDPANPVQISAVDIGQSRSHHGECLSGDNEFFFVANNLDGTVTQLNAVAGTVTKTLTVKANPRTVATWHEHEGPSHQTGPVE